MVRRSQRRPFFLRVAVRKLFTKVLEKKKFCRLLHRASSAAAAPVPSLAILRVSTARLTRTQRERILQGSTIFSGGRGAPRARPQPRGPKHPHVPASGSGAAAAPSRGAPQPPRCDARPRPPRGDAHPRPRRGAPRPAPPPGAPTPGAASYHLGFHGDKHAHYYFLETLWLFFFLPSYF